MRDGFFKPTELNVIQAPQSRVPKCGLCKLHTGCKSPKTGHLGRGKRGILVVADDANQPATLPNTDLGLVTAFRKFGVEFWDDCWYTHSLTCRNLNHGVEVSQEAVRWCRANLLNLIDRLKPTTIILIGNMAVESLIGHIWDEDVDGVVRWAGYRIPSTALNAWVCPVFHPHHLEKERNPVMEMMFTRHLEAALELKGRPYETVPDFKGRVECITSPSLAGSRVRDLSGSTAVAFDYETTTLKPDGPHAEIVSCSVSNGKVSIAYPWHGPAIEATRRLLVNPRVKKIASNAKFESRWTRAKLGVEVQGWMEKQADTMLTSHALENATKSRYISSIKFQAFVHLGVPLWNRQVEPYLKAGKKDGTNAPNRIKEVDLPTLLMYNGLDSLYEFLVAKKQNRILRCRDGG